MLTQSARIRATLSILILLFASFTPIPFAYEEINELESQDKRYDSSTVDQKAWEWAVGGGSSSSDTVKDMIVLPSGDIYLAGIFRSSITIGAVSYTHLTLPTNREV